MAERLATTVDDLMLRFYQQQAEAEREEEHQRTAQMRALETSIRMQDTLRNQAALQLQFLEQSAPRPRATLHTRRFSASNIEREKESFTFPAPAVIPARTPISPEVIKTEAYGRMSRSLPVLPVLEKPNVQEQQGISTNDVKRPFNLPSALNGFLRDQGGKLGITADSQEASRLMQCIQTASSTPAPTNNRNKEEEEREERRIVARALRKVKKSSSPKRPTGDINRINKLYGGHSRSTSDSSDNGDDTIHHQYSDNPLMSSGEDSTGEKEKEKSHGISIKSLINDNDSNIMTTNGFQVRRGSIINESLGDTMTMRPHDDHNKQLDEKFSNLKLDPKAIDQQITTNKKTSVLKFTAKRGLRVSTGSPRNRRVRFVDTSGGSPLLASNRTLSYLQDGTLNSSPNNSPTISPQQKRRRMSALIQARNIIMESKRRDKNNSLGEFSMEKLAAAAESQKKLAESSV